MNKTSAFIRFALACFAAAVTFAGCNGPQASTVPAHASFSELKAPVASASQEPGGVKTASEDLIYLSYGSCGSFTGECYAEVAIYTFPGGDPIGTWNAAGYALGECADKAGNVFVTYILGSVGEVFEFAHGDTSPAKTLSDPAGFPVACSVDTDSGDLAVVNDTGSLSIYTHASGNPTTFNYPGVTLNSVGYGDRGTLFVDGLTAYPSSKFVLAKLPKGGSSFENVTPNKQVNGAEELFWDGKYLALQAGYNQIYRFEIRGSSGRFVGATQPKHLRGGIDQYWIVDNQIVAAYSWKPCRAICSDEGTVGIWHYPSGRVITKHFTPDLSPAAGMALSLAQHRGLLDK